MHAFVDYVVTICLSLADFNVSFYLVIRIILSYFEFPLCLWNKLQSLTLQHTYWHRGQLNSESLLRSLLESYLVNTYIYCYCLLFVGEILMAQDNHEVPALKTDKTGSG